MGSGWIADRPSESAGGVAVDGGGTGWRGDSSSARGTTERGGAAGVEVPEVVTAVASASGHRRHCVA